MKAANVRELKKALNECSPEELLALCLRLAKFKKENKELLTYLLFEAGNETQYVESVKAEMEAQFAQITTRSYYLIKKMVRKILRTTKKYIRYSGNKETEVELLLHFCFQMKAIRPSIQHNRVLQGLYGRQRALIEKKVAALHEDLQYDYELELNRLAENNG